MPQVSSKLRALLAERHKQLLVEEDQLRDLGSLLEGLREKQRPPPGRWFIWLLRTGQGWGKNHTGSTWINDLVLNRGYRRVALISATAADVRDTMVLNPRSGILATCPSAHRPRYQPSYRRVLWPNGAEALMFSAEEPEQLRGPEFQAAWADEVDAWGGTGGTATRKKADEAWTLLELRVRLSPDPRILVTSTPKPGRIVSSLGQRVGTDVVMVTGSTWENQEHLDKGHLARLAARYAGTRLSRQELEGELLEDVPGALWTRDLIEERMRITPGEVPPRDQLRRIVIGLDPQGGGEDEAGIIAVAMGPMPPGYRGPTPPETRCAYVLKDWTTTEGSRIWSKRAASLYHEVGADLLVAEKNFGGDMVLSTLQAADPTVMVKLVNASRGKHVRAEPVATLSEQGRIRLVGVYPELEDELCNFTSGGYQGHTSPGRADAMVWAVTEMMLVESKKILTRATWGRGRVA